MHTLKALDQIRKILKNKPENKDLPPGAKFYFHLKLQEEKQANHKFSSGVYLTASKLRFSVKNIRDCSKFLSGFLSYSTGKEFNSQRIINCLETEAL